MKQTNLENLWDRLRKDSNIYLSRLSNLAHKKGENFDYTNPQIGLQWQIHWKRFVHTIVILRYNSVERK